MKGELRRVVVHPEHTLPLILEGKTPVGRVVGPAPSTPDLEGKLWFVEAPGYPQLTLHEEQLAPVPEYRPPPEVRRAAEMRARAIRQGVEARMGGRFREDDGKAIDEVVYSVIIEAIGDGRLAVADLHATEGYRADHCPRCVRHVEDCTAPEDHRGAWLEMVAVGPYHDTQ